MKLLLCILEILFKEEHPSSGIAFRLTIRNKFHNFLDGTRSVCKFYDFPSQKALGEIEQTRKAITERAVAISVIFHENIPGI